MGTHHLRRIGRVVIGATIVITAFAYTASAQPDYTRRERKACTACHVGTWTSGKLTDMGAFYAKSRSLKNYVPRPASGHATDATPPAGR